MKNIKLKMGAASIIITVVVLACTVLLNVIVGVITDKHPLKIDLTRDKVYEFSAQTKDVMKSLSSDITAYAIIPDETDAEYVEYIKAYLEKYVLLNDRFKVSYVDPYKDTAFMSKYVAQDRQITIGTVVLECGDKFKIVTADEFYTSDYFENVQRIDMEKKITNSVMELTGNLLGANVYFLSGHKELETNNLSALFEGEGHKSETINILADKIPSDADVIICVAPQTDFSEEEIEALSAYLDNGGRFILAAHPGIERMEKLDGYLKTWGMELNYDSIVESDARYATTVNNVSVPAARLIEHGVNEKIMQSDAKLAMPYSMSIAVRKSSNGAAVTGLLSTSERAYGKTNLNSTNPQKEDGDIDGPLYMAAIAERNDANIKSGVMLLGSSIAFEMPLLLSEGVYLNSDFILNSIAYMTDSAIVSDIRAKQISPEIMSMTESQAKAARNFVMIWLPVIILLAGLVIWLGRRFK